MDITIKGLPNEDIIQGFPGLPATDPRALGVVCIRPSSKNGPVRMKKPMGILKVNVSLVRTDSINVSGNHKEVMYLISQQDIYNGEEGDVYGMDLPFVLPIGKSGKVTGSMSVPDRFIQTTHSLFVRVKTNQQVQEPASRFPVYVRRYDTLSTFSRYLKPWVKNISSPDHLVNLQCTLTASAYGHGDKILAYFHLSPNPDYKKANRVKLLRISLELVQIVKFTKACATTEKEKIPEPRRTRMCKESYEFQEVYLNESTVQDVKLVVPSHPPPSSVDRYNVGPANAIDVPLEGRVGFTNSCALFEVSFALVFKVRLRHARDIEVEHPITISEFNHGSCVEYVKSIVQTAELAQYGSSAMMQRRVFTNPPALEVQII